MNVFDKFIGWHHRNRFLFCAAVFTVAFVVLGVIRAAERLIQESEARLVASDDATCRFTGGYLLQGLDDRDKGGRYCVYDATPMTRLALDIRIGAVKTAEERLLEALYVVVSKRDKPQLTMPPLNGAKP